MKTLAIYASFELREGPRPDTTVLAPREGVDPALAADRLERIARAHQQLSHPSIPRVESWDGASVVFASDTKADLEACISTAEEWGERVPYAVGIALPTLIADALSHAHAARDVGAQHGVFLGGASLRNVRVRPNGHIHLFGFGHNFVVRDLHGALAVDSGVFGGERAPSATSDLLAFYEMTRSLMSLVDLPPSLARVFQGQRGAELGLLGNLLEWAMRRLIGRAPHDRGVTVEEAMHVYRIAWRLLGVSPDIQAFRALLARTAAPAPAVDDHVVLDGDRVLLPSGRSIDLATRGAARRMLHALAAATSAGRSLSTDELFAAGWPGQRLDAETRSRRVRVELSRLRALGLRHAIKHAEAGFTLRSRGA